jgi:hypothetical protein
MKKSLTKLVRLFFIGVFFSTNCLRDNPAVLFPAQTLQTPLDQGFPGRLLVRTQAGDASNAALRQRLAWLTRRTRHLAHQGETLLAGMFTVGCFYNFGDEQQSLRLKLLEGRQSQRLKTSRRSTGNNNPLWFFREQRKSHKGFKSGLNADRSGVWGFRQLCRGVCGGRLHSRSIRHQTR